MTKQKVVRDGSDDIPPKVYEFKGDITLFEAVKTIMKDSDFGTAIVLSDGKDVNPNQSSRKLSEFTNVHIGRKCY